MIDLGLLLGVLEIMDVLVIEVVEVVVVCGYFFGVVVVLIVELEGFEEKIEYE